MGFVKSIFGGGDKPRTPPPPKKPEPTSMEIELAEQGVERLDRYNQRYAPLEDRMIEGINRPTEGLLRGRTNADIMQEATDQATRSIAASDVGTGIRSLRDLSGAVSRAQSANSTAAIVGDRALRDDRALAAIETGIGMSGRQVEGLAALGASQNRKALTFLQAEEQEKLARYEAKNFADRARSEAVAGVLGTAAGAGTAAYKDIQTRKRLDMLTRAPALRDFRDY